MTGVKRTKPFFAKVSRLFGGAEPENCLPRQEAWTDPFEDFIRQVLSGQQHRPVTVCVSGFSRGHGVTTILHKTALAMDVVRIFDGRALLIDTQGGPGSLSSFCADSPGPGFPEAMNGGLSLREAVRSFGVRVDLMPAGIRRQDSGASQEAYRRFFQSLNQQYPLIFIDAPALDQPDSMPFVKSSDMLFAVLASESLNAKSADSAVRKITRLNGKIDGIILNRQKRSIPSWIY